VSRLTACAGTPVRCAAGCGGCAEAHTSGSRRRRGASTMEAQAAAEGGGAAAQPVDQRPSFQQGFPIPKSIMGE
jgi:AhpD family alkylhydroperoxidase